MKIVTFCGKCSTLEITCKHIHHDYVLVDSSYHDEIPRVPHVIVDSGEPYPSENEVISRRIRISRLIMESNKMVDEREAILFLDSDVYIQDMRKVKESDTPYTLQIMAKIKPLNVIKPFNTSTNMYIPPRERSKLNEYLELYLKKRLSFPVDVWLNVKMRSRVVAIEGTCHLIDGKEYCV